MKTTISMAPGNKTTVSNHQPMVTPVAALTRFRPDTRSLNNRAGVRADYIRQGVKVGAMGLFLPYQEKVEIIELDSVCPIPNTPMWFMGMINSRGNLLPVFDLKLLMGMQVEQASRWLMILGHGGNAAGLCIDTLPTNIENPQQTGINEIDAQTAGFPATLRPHLAGVYLHGGMLWMDIEYNRLFLDICAKF